MNLTELTAFCKSWGDLSSPFYHNHFVYATDGNLAVRLLLKTLMTSCLRRATATLLRWRLS